jgi:hypothetical protein
MALLSGGVLGRDHPEGNYDERAFMAATVGPFRLPFGSTSTKNFTAAKRQQKIFRNVSAQVIFVSIALEPNAPVVLVTFGKSDTPSPSTDVQHDFSIEPTFQCVLLPDEQLCATAGGATRIAITEVGF